MPIWLTVLWKVYSPLAAIALPIVLIAGAGFWFTEAERVSSLNSQIAALDCRIDGPQKPNCTMNGYVVLLGAANAATAQVRANLATCQKTVDDSNAKIAALGMDAAAKQKATQAALADLQMSQRSADQLSAAIASFKPTKDACADAFTILGEVGR